MLIGFGCTIPAIMATRTLESRRDRLITMLILPFISCGARLPIYLLLIPAFFPRSWHAPVLWGLYMLGIFLGLVVARILRKTLLGGREAPFVMELPPYRMPGRRSVLLHMWTRSAMYMRKAGTIILGVSILLWVLVSYPKAPENNSDLVTPGAAANTEAVRAARDLEYSLAGRIGHMLEPITAPMGFDWKVNTAFLGAFAAKEVFVAQIAIVFAMEDGVQGNDGLREVLSRHYSPVQGLSILIFALLATPCMATVAIMRRESGRWSWAALQWFGITGLGYVLATLVFQLGSRLIG
jgi:ferrous iron transport protein B